MTTLLNTIKKQQNIDSKHKIIIQIENKIVKIWTKSQNLSKSINLVKIRNSGTIKKTYFLTLDTNVIFINLQ